MVAGSNPAGGATVRRFVGELAALTPFKGVYAATSSEMRGGLRCSNAVEHLVDFLYDSFIYNDSGECRAT